MNAELLAQREAAQVQSAGGLRAFAFIASLTVAVLGIYAPTTRSMIEIWLRSETFNHCFIVVPVFLWFVWTRRAVLAGLPAEPFWPGLLAVAGSGLLWLLSELASAAAPAQIALIAMVPTTLLAVLGWRWLQALLFPCALLFFAAPFGEVFVPTLIQWTADFTVLALRLTGVPVYREGAHFVIPTGQWSVIDACSGIRYLIASAMSGILFAWLIYRSPWRRAIFIGAALIVPIVANWLRAYGIVMLGHLTGHSGPEHRFYGWVFFGVVILAFFAVGTRWREDSVAGPVPGLAEAGVSSHANVGPARINVIALAAAALAMLVWPPVRAALMTPFGGTLPVAAPTLSPQAGWHPADSFSKWHASAHRPTVERTAWFVNEGRAVGVQLSIYRDQSQGSELVSSANKLVDADEKEAWHIAQQRRDIGSDWEGTRAFRTTLLIADKPLAVRDWYWLGDRTTVSEVDAKIDLALDRLLRRDDVSAWVILFTPVTGNFAEAQSVLDAFWRDMGPPIAKALQEMRR
jgi:exosortase A